jgi:CheY-like chemotaxis protein
MSVTPNSSRKHSEPSALVVDDNFDVRQVLSRVLVSRGWGAHTCRDGLSALQLLSEYCFDAVIADLHMPGIAGPRLLEHAKSVCPDTVLVMISGWPASWAREHAERIGATVLTKPIDHEELMGVLNGRRPTPTKPA